MTHLIPLQGRLEDLLKDSGVSEQDRRRLAGKLGEILNYRPTIGVLGKTGVGKSSLCNALFGQEVAAVSDVEACTRQPQEVLLTLGSNSLCLVDVPGVGENADRDEEYAALYASLLPRLDVVLWLLKADDRAYSVDEQFYREIVEPHIAAGKPFFFVLTQSDKIEPFREWNETAREPGPNQLANLEKRRQYVARSFGVPPSRVLPVSAAENYQLAQLIEEIVFALPDEQKIGFVREVKPEMVTEKARKEARSGFVRTAGKVLAGAGLGAAVGSFIPGIGTAIGAAVGGALGWLFS